MVEVISDYYYRYNANIHRGVHKLSQEATDAYEKARTTIQKHFNAAHPMKLFLLLEQRKVLMLLQRVMLQFSEKRMNY